MNIESEMKRIEDYRELRRNTDYPNFSIFYEPKVYYFEIVLSQVFDTLAKQFDSHHLCLKFLYWLSFTNQFQCNFYATVLLFKKKMLYYANFKVINSFILFSNSYEK